MNRAKLLAIGVVAGLLGAGCSTATTGSPPAASSSSMQGATAASCLVGEAWDAYAEARIAQRYQPAMEMSLDAAGYDYDFVDAKANPQDQAAQIDEFVARGAKVIVVRVQGDFQGSLPPATESAIERATAAGAAVISYDRIVDSPKALAIAFDLVDIGRMEAVAILAAKPHGNYVIVKGHPEGQIEPDLIASGIHEVLQPAIDRGDIKIISEDYTVNWDPYLATEKMRSVLSQNHNQIDAVIAENDGMAGGVIAALTEVGLDGKVAVAGQGGEIGGLNRVAAGTQTVDVWPDLRLLGGVAGQAAVALCRNRDIAQLQRASSVSLPNGHRVSAILLEPQAITRDNLNLAIDSGWTEKGLVCASIAPSGAPLACR